MKRAMWRSPMLWAIVGLTSTTMAYAHVSDRPSMDQFQLAGLISETPHIRTVMDEPIHNMTSEQRDQLRRKMRERWERMSPEERREMEERLREYQAHRFWTPAS